MPVIVTNVGGPKENLVPGKTGLIVEGNDTESLKNAIFELVSEPGLAKLRDMGSHARDYCVERTCIKPLKAPGTCTPDEISHRAFRSDGFGNHKPWDIPCYEQMNQQLKKL